MNCKHQCHKWKTLVNVFGNGNAIGQCEKCYMPLYISIELKPDSPEEKKCCWACFGRQGTSAGGGTYCSKNYFCDCHKPEVSQAKAIEDLHAEKRKRMQEKEMPDCPKSGQPHYGCGRCYPKSHFAEKTVAEPSSIDRKVDELKRTYWYGVLVEYGSLYANDVESFFRTALEEATNNKN